MRRKIQRSAGVYQIRCKSNGKIYIGSAVDLHNRFEQHKRGLRRGSHPNTHLQAAWDKYDEKNFEFTVLEITERSNLLQTEQHWLDKSQSFKRRVGFNISNTAGSPGDIFAQTWEGFIDPSGNEVTIQNLFDFCRQNNLDFPSMHRLAKGKSKLKSYKGWSHKNSIRQREYVKTYTGFIDPDGNSIGPITNLAAFCRNNGLDDTHMVAVAHGRFYSHRGWTYQNSRKNLGRKTYTRFVDPNGKKVIITNLQEFCREHNLTIAHMRGLISGKRKSHKGWTWSSTDE
jgi:group I intron endonuclease